MEFDRYDSLLTFVIEECVVRMVRYYVFGGLNGRMSISKYRGLR